MSITLTKKQKVATLFSIVITLTSSSISCSAQQCGNDPSLCCSKYGYCGNDDDYCDNGCLSSAPSCDEPTPASGSSGVSVSDVVTQEFFDGLLSQATDDPCPGTNFYTRDAFLNATADYPEFGAMSSADYSKREIAAFFAHVSFVTGSLCKIEKNGGAASTNTYCDANYAKQYPCTPGKKYYGRGPLQITWNYNYALVGNSIGFDGLNAPETLANDANMSFKSAMWFWMTNVHSVVNQGFGATNRAINGDAECNGNDQSDANAHISLYKQYCDSFGVAYGANLTC